MARELPAHISTASEFHKLAVDLNTSARASEHLDLAQAKKIHELVDEAISILGAGEDTIRDLKVIDFALGTMKDNESVDDWGLRKAAYSAFGWKTELQKTLDELTKAQAEIRGAHRSLSRESSPLNSPRSVSPDLPAMGRETSPVDELGVGGPRTLVGRLLARGPVVGPGPEILRQRMQALQKAIVKQGGLPAPKGFTTSKKNKPTKQEGRPSVSHSAAKPIGRGSTPPPPTAIEENGSYPVGKEEEVFLTSEQAAELTAPTGMVPPPAPPPLSTGDRSATLRKKLEDQTAALAELDRYMAFTSGVLERFRNVQSAIETHKENVDILGPRIAAAKERLDAARASIQEGLLIQSVKKLDGEGAKLGNEGLEYIPPGDVRLTDLITRFSGIVSTLESRLAEESASLAEANKFMEDYSKRQLAAPKRSPQKVWTVEELSQHHKKLLEDRASLQRDVDSLPGRIASAEKGGYKTFASGKKEVDLSSKEGMISSMAKAPAQIATKGFFSADGKGEPLGCAQDVAMLERFTFVTATIQNLRTLHDGELPPSAESNK